MLAVEGGTEYRSVLLLVFYTGKKLKKCDFCSGSVGTNMIFYIRAYSYIHLFCMNIYVKKKYFLN